MKELVKYPISEAIKLLKKEPKRKFDSTVELHININVDTKKQDEQVRYTTVLPHGTGKTLRVAVMASQKVKNADLELTEADVAKIEKGEIRPGRDFDILVAEPKTMPKLAKAARILGPAGAMPNPKAGTVSEDVEKAVELIKKGKVEIKTEQNFPIIHTRIGKLSFEPTQLEQNYSEIMTTLASHKPPKVKGDLIKSAFVTTTMGKSYQLEV